MSCQRTMNLLCSCNKSSDSMSFVIFKESRQTKISNFWHHIVIEQYVCRFEVQMNYGSTKFASALLVKIT